MTKEATLTISLPESLRQELDREAKIANRPVERLVIGWIQMGLQDRKAGQGNGQRERELAAIEKTGLLPSAGEARMFFEGLKKTLGLEGHPTIDRGELRRRLGSISLSNLIIAERNEGR